VQLADGYLPAVYKVSLGERKSSCVSVEKHV
jgi:hypothetical protein